MSFFIDAILIAIVILCVVIGFKKGFVDEISGIVSLGGSIFVTWFFHTKFADFLYNNFLLDSITDYIKSSYEKEIGSSGTSLPSLFNDLPQFFQNFLNRFSSVDQSQEYFASNTSATPDEFCRYLASPIARTLSYVLSLVILFLISFIVLKIITFLINKAVELPLLSGLDSFLGTVLGLIVGFIFAWVISIAFNGLLPQLSKLYPTIFSPTITENTIIMKFFYNFNLFKLLDLFKI